MQNDEQALTAADFPPGTKWYHGGHPDVEKSGWVLPASQVGLKDRNPLSDTYESGRVYVSLELDFSIRFAAKVPNLLGAVYEVEPCGELEIDYGEAIGSDCPAFTCERARIVRKVMVPIEVLRRKRAELKELAVEMLRENIFEEQDAAARQAKIEQIADRIAARHRQKQNNRKACIKKAQDQRRARKRQRRLKK